MRRRRPPARRIDDVDGQAVGTEFADGYGLVRGQPEGLRHLLSLFLDAEHGEECFHARMGHFGRSFVQCD
jgi:hypothetical protein